MGRTTKLHTYWDYFSSELVTTTCKDYPMYLRSQALGLSWPWHAIRIGNNVVVENLRPQEKFRVTMNGGLLMLHTKIVSHAATVAAVLLCSYAGPLHAQSTTDNRGAAPLAGQTLPAETLRESRFRFLDLNGDQHITLNEIDTGNSVLRSQFDSLDWNHDGRLSKSEYVTNGRPE